jgi:hypothetical protein
MIGPLKAHTPDLTTLALLGMLALHVHAGEPISCQAERFPLLRGPYLGQAPPGDQPVLFAPGVVSTCREHSAAMFTPDGTEIWFGRMFPSAIYVMSMEHGRWAEPRHLGSDINLGRRHGGASLSLRGALYYNASGGEAGASTAPWRATAVAPLPSAWVR